MAYPGGLGSSALTVNFFRVRIHALLWGAFFFWQLRNGDETNASDVQPLMVENRVPRHETVAHGRGKTREKDFAFVRFFH